MEKEKSYIATLKRTEHAGKEKKIHIPANCFVDAANKAEWKASKTFCEVVKLEVLE